MEKFPFNNKSLRDRRRELRSNQTEYEKKLWECLRGRRLNGIKFYRQYSIGPYVVDFYCSQFKLAVEIDGDAHNGPEEQKYDQERENYMKSYNVSTVRFWNQEVANDIQTVLEKISQAISKQV